MAIASPGGRWRTLVLGLASVCWAGTHALAELPAADLAVRRQVTEREWLELRLEVLGLRLSYPAYRVHLRLDDDRTIAFDFLASSGLAAHLTEDTDAREAAEVMAYHAQGIQEQVADMLQRSYPALASRFDSRQDFHGQFLGPGSAWDDPPVTIGYWRNGQYSWAR